MTRRRRRPSKVRIKNKYQPDYRKEAKLDLRSVVSFKYYLEQILDDSLLDENSRSSFTANLITKASRGSLREAKDYVRYMAREGVLKEKTSDRICELLDRNRKFR